MDRARAPAWAIAIAIVAVGAAAPGCSKPPPDRANVGYGLALQATGGVYDDGSGVLGLAVLSTLRDASGAGPSAPWTVALRDDVGPLPVGFAYGAGPGDSWQARWWPGVPPRTASYGATADDGTRTLEVSFPVAAEPGLARPDVSVSSDAGLLSWPAIPWAASYECRVYQSGAEQAAIPAGAVPECDLGSLASGAYQVSVLALSADLAALAASAAQEPPLPARFDVAETRLAVVRPAPGQPALRIAAAGGALQYGSAEPGLAVWLSIVQPDGTPANVPWSVNVTGPGLPPDAPLSFAYAAGQTRALVWSYDVSARPGVYTLTAMSSLGSVAASFTVGSSATLALPQDVVATGDARGGASVSFTAVVGAQSHYVGVWTQANATTASTFVTGRWVSGPPATFPAGSFVAGAAYDVYVAATDVDMVNAGAQPAQVAVSENTFFPASFVSR
jgi:hypothetical protein